MFHYVSFDWEGQSQDWDRLSTYHNRFDWRERAAAAEWSRGPSAYQPNALPLGHTGSQSSSAGDANLSGGNQKTTY